MNQALRAWVWVAAAIACAGLRSAEPAAPPLELLAASYFGTAEDDDLEGGCAAPDGTLYVVGNAGAGAANLPGGVQPTTFGDAAAEPKCGLGFIAHLSADASKVLGYAQFGKGLVCLTTVQVNAQGVYAGGYAADGLERLLADRPGLIRKYPLTEEVRLIREGKIAEANGLVKDPLADAPGLSRSGAPCVLKLSPDLKTLQAGTYLEGWEQVWTKHRQIGRTKDKKGIMMPLEHSHQPTHLALLKSGDVVVCHDGGYFRLLTDKDRQFAQQNAERLVQENPNPPPEKPDQPVPDKAARIEKYRAGMLNRLAFYDVCDYLSRLSPDLAQRVYRKEIYTPATDLETAKKIKDGWPFPHYSSPRTLGMRLDKEERLYLSGWSASATSREPWWSPFIWELNSSDGSLRRKINETDPMSGGGNRMNGSVADAAIGALTLEEDGNLVYQRFSDGGFAGVIHFSGSIRRWDMKELKSLESARTAPCAWAVDLATLPQGHVLALGRCNGSVQWTADGWQPGDVNENPEAWLRVYGPKLEQVFSTAIRGVVPYQIVPLSEQRFLIVGESRGTLNQTKTGADGSVEVAAEDNPGVALTKNALFEKPRGKSDGYFMIVEWKGRLGAPEAAPAPPPSPRF